MNGSSTEDFGTSVMSSQTEGISVGQRCQSTDSLAEWRSSEQLENGTPSTSPPYWDTDDDDGDCGPRPSELYGKFTWRIDNYSQINKRELRSNAFEVGGYKWYILIYPQGCDVCNHLSLFLCVANHDKLLPGWSHFAQFTIAVVNKDPKCSKFSDTLHRFWKKEHDWGWKKFMELTKVQDGFINNDTLIIKAQVQVIREKALRPFRCLDCQYRRELVRVYLSNVEQICRRFFEDKKNKLSKLMDDKVRWSSFCSFWLGIDQISRRRISRDNLDTILRVVVKHFFVEKEVTSTLVLDSLYSGLKALECQSKNKEESPKIDMEESTVPMVRIDKDMFVLVDDIISLLDRVASEPLPTISLPPKDDKGSQNRTKEGSSADDFKDSIERDERRLTELGRRTVEVFVLAHIYSRIEVAYQEAVALKRQEELIREEEAAGHELKAKRGATEKDKRTKKKQSKQKRSYQKNKEKQRDLKSDSAINDRKLEEKSLDEKKSRELSLKHMNVMNGRMETPEDASDVSYNGDDVAEPIYPDLEDRDSSPRNYDADALEFHPSIEASASEMPNYRPEKTNLGLDDSSSTCSTDSVIINNIQTSPNRENSYGSNHLENHQSVISHHGEILDSSPSSCQDLEGDDASQKRSVQRHESHLVEKQDPTAILRKKTSKDQGDAEKLSNILPLVSSSASPDPVRNTPPFFQHPKQSAQNNTTGTNLITSSITPKRSHSSTKNITAPSIAPFIPVAPRPNTSPFAPSYSPQSYRNAIIGKPAVASNPSEFAHYLSISSTQSSTSSPQSASSSLFPPPSAARKELELTFGSVINQQCISTSNNELCNSNFFRRERVSIAPLYQSHGGGVVDEFPHLDIINDLLNEEQSTSNHHCHPLHHRHRSFSGRNSLPVDRFDRTERYYDDGFLSIHSSSSDRALVRLHDWNFAPIDLSAANSLIQNHSPYHSGNLSLIELSNARGGGGGFSYHNLHDYANLRNGRNGYGLYWP